MELKNKLIDDVLKDVSALSKVRGINFAKHVLKMRTEVVEARGKIVKARQAPETPEIMEYEAELEKIYDKFVAKNERGEPIMSNGNPVIKDMRKLEKEIEELNTRLSGARKQLDVFDEGYTKFLEESSFEISPIIANIIPSDVNAEELLVINKYTNK